MSRSPKYLAADRAKFVAMFVRNELEDFHVAHLSDQQMAELNPIIRNAVFSALDAWGNADHIGALVGVVKKYPNVWLSARKDMSPHQRVIAFNLGMVPEYWEEPQFTEHYQKSLATDFRDQSTPTMSAGA